MPNVVALERIEKLIYLIRGQKVMLDRDLAELYDVDTSQLKRAVRRNIERFPKDFMFKLTKQELKDWRGQFGTSNGDKSLPVRHHNVLFPLASDTETSFFKSTNSLEMIDTGDFRHDQIATSISRTSAVWMDSFIAAKYS